ncbi:fatty acyl-CoA reductase 2, chloroplastic-like [Argentina anserina]|uniref:fatty acyl-CoA reductase 2, chloroplastic-like n=1 Tax=Argentina anserina TaxID=57926 RepID=UPI00217648FA|nr:fatty acyl-CoA reductase 2, chloroplastic-like [Potentilla anserina]
MEGNRIRDPIVLYYGKGQLTGFLVDPNGVLDVDINIYQITSSVHIQWHKLFQPAQGNCKCSTYSAQRNHVRGAQTRT